MKLLHIKLKKERKNNNYNKQRKGFTKEKLT